MNSRALNKSYGVDIIIPIMSPGLIFSTLYQYTDTSILFALFILTITIYSVYTNYNIFISVKGFIFKAFISCLIFNSTGIALHLVPQTHDYVGGIFLYLCIPLWPAAFYLVFYSKEAIEVRALWFSKHEKKYNK